MNAGAVLSTPSGTTWKVLAPMCPQSTCSVEGCERPIHTRGLCTAHYAKWWRAGGDDTVIRRAKGRLCSIEGCTRPHEARGLCGTHYQRWRHSGDPMVVKTTRPLAERFWEKVDRSGGADSCWEWQAVRSKRGYGRFTIGHSHVVSAYRIAYELTRGPIPDGLELDHLCRNPACVNPTHLEPVTHLVNMHRSPHVGKFTIDQIHDVRDRHAQGESASSIARFYGVSSSTIGYIVARKTWRHV